MSQVDKYDRICYLVATSIKNTWSPKDVGFADRIIRVSASHFAVDSRTSHSYVRILVDAFRGNRWFSYIKDNGYLSDEEKEAWKEANLPPH